ncbi:NAD(P)H-dependent oxidoreductase [Pseudomonas vanderleydeniana]|uniref:NAD(P)H-dependent oxidoreductase n=1 Tax=Pseudomonas vanderleydeniana TaxID=2745495 RepID=A0A9E6TUU1_9PSED|nr:NAD(P)H-dependent oxidoreductase [Pseudomonas vanderleydeniana]QXI31184.1 NAD(P)H-dependent oxidoreductase [Pseudomonas vanderleydeniana]
MHSLIVVAHPNPDSLTHAIARCVAQGIAASGPQHTSEIADLAAEGFDPRFNQADQALFMQQAAVPADVAAEQERVDRAQALVMVYPIYWWSFPALLKGWIDRVFSMGWAYEDSGNGKVVKKLQRLQVHLVAVGGADAGTFTRHGYAPAMKTQIDHGIFDYCGAHVRSSDLLLASDEGYPQAHLQTAQRIGAGVVASQP